jgi:membrane fusion protein (multidrug efflux system)
LRAIALGVAVVSALSLAACGDKNDGAQNAQAAAQAKPPEVGVVTVKLGSVPLVTDLPGRLEAFRTAQVRARAAGILQSACSRKARTSRPAALPDRQHALPGQSAKRASHPGPGRSQWAGGRHRTPLQPLVGNAISKQDYDTAIAAEKAALAQVAAGKAGDQRQCQPGLCRSHRPHRRRIGRAMVTEGAGRPGRSHAAGHHPADPSAVRQPDPVFERHPALKEALAAGKLTRDGANAAKVHVFTEDGKEYGHTGRMLFTDLTVDENTGQVSVRAELPNPNGLLLPGMYVRAAGTGPGGQRRCHSPAVRDPQ